MFTSPLLTRERSRSSDSAVGWTTEESWFDSERGGGSSISKGRDRHWSTAKLVLSGYRGLFTWGVKLTTRLASRLRMDGAIPSLLRMLSCCVQGQRYLTPSVFPWRTICSLLLRKYYFCTEKLASVTLKQTYDVSDLLPFCLAGAARP